MNLRFDLEPPGEAGSISLETWVAYFEGRLLDAEEQSVRALLAKSPAARKYAVELAASLSTDEHSAIDTPETEVDLENDRPTNHLRIVWRHPGLAAVAATFLVCLAWLWFAGGRKPFGVTPDFASATQVAILVEGQASHRRGSGSTPSPDSQSTGTANYAELSLAAGSPITLSSATPSRAGLLFCAIDNGGHYRELLRREVSPDSGDDPLAFVDAVAPGAGQQTLFLMLIAQRAFDAKIVDRLRYQARSILRATSSREFAETTRAFTWMVARELGCLVHARLVTGILPKTGALQGSDRPKATTPVASTSEVPPASGTAQVLDAATIRGVRKKLCGGDLQPALGLPQIPTDEPGWTAREAQRLRSLARALAQHSDQIASWVRAEKRRLEAQRRFATAVALGSSEQTARELRTSLARCREAHRELDSVRNHCGQVGLGASRRWLPTVGRVRKLEAQILMQAHASGIELAEGAELDTAFRALDQLRTSYVEHNLIWHPTYGSILNDLAGLCRTRGDLVPARLFATEAVQALQTSGASARRIAEAMRQLASVHRTLGDEAAAESNLARAATVLEQAPHTGSSTTLLAVGRLHLALSRATHAMERDDDDMAACALAKAESLARTEDTGKYKGSILALRVELALRDGSPAALEDAHARWLKLRAHDLERFGADHPILALDDVLGGRIARATGRLQAAKSRFESALTVLESTLSDQQDDFENRARLSDGFGVREVASSLADIELAHANIEGAFRFVERAHRWRRIGALGRGAGSGSGEGTPGSSHHTERLQQLEARRERLHFQLASLDDSRTQGRRVEQRRAQLRRELSDAVRDLWACERAGGCRLSRPSASTHASTKNSLGELIAPADTLLWFSWTAEVVRLFWLPPAMPGELRNIRCATIASGRSNIEKLRALVESVAADLEGVEQRSPGRAIAANAQLADRLLPRDALHACANASKILLMPDGPINRLSIDALVLDSTDPTDWAECTFVMDAVPAPWIRIDGLGALPQSARGELSIDGFALLVGDARTNHVDLVHVENSTVAGTDTPRNAGALDSLPETATEVRLVSRQLERAGCNATTLLGPRARADLVLEQLHRRPTIVHLASHGRLGDAFRPELAGIELTPPRPFASGLLNLGEILTTWSTAPEPPKLVVLSACQTGLGPSGPFEVASLPAALHAIGVEHVIASLWRVPSSPTVQWMASFYGALTDGQHPAEGANRARRRLREQWPHPSRWAGFRYFSRR